MGRWGRKRGVRWGDKRMQWVHRKGEGGKVVDEMREYVELGCGARGSSWWTK